MDDNTGEQMPPPPEEVGVRKLRQVPGDRQSQQPYQNPMAQQPAQYPPQPPPQQYPQYPQSQYNYPYYSHYGYQYPQQYQPLPKKPEEPKKFLGLSPVIWVIALVVILVFGCAVAAYLLMPPGPEWTTSTYETEIIIAEGGHYRHTLGDGYYNDEIKIDLYVASSTGMRFDVYIMDEDQYYNSYASENDSISVFSTLFAWEDITRVNTTQDLSDAWGRLPGLDSLYLILDNRDNPLTPDDASPSGTVTLNLRTEVKSRYIYYM